MDFWTYSGRAFMMGTNRIGRFSQHDTLVGAAIIGTILVAPLAGGIVGAVLGLAVVIVPSIIAAVVVVTVVFAIGAHAQSQEAEQQIETHRDEAAYYKAIIEAQEGREANLKTKAALVDEGYDLVEAILLGGDDDLPRHELAATEWKERTKDFLTSEAHERSADAAAFIRSFDRTSEPHIKYKGKAHTGDRALLAAKVHNATFTLSEVYISEGAYLDYRSVAAAREATAEENNGKAYA